MLSVLVRTQSQAPMYRKRRIIDVYSGGEFWQWFDLMPKSVRDEINKAKDMDEALHLWQDAINRYGDEIERKLNK